VKEEEKTVSQEGLPDPQNSGSLAIQGANVPIMQVGMSDFRLPLRYATKGRGVMTLETSVTGTVSLAADYKGVNMSRIMRGFYRFEDRVFTPELLEEILREMKEELGSSRARLKLSFSYPILKESLRSGLAGWQYYNAAFEGSIDDLDVFTRIVHFDYVYSSACPCSAELSEHAKNHRGVYAVPHSQRSRARISAAVARGSFLAIEDLQQIALSAVPTETQVMVKRDDEQAFAELNGEHLMFVEDAARLFFEKLDADRRIADFQVVLVHMESLHSHDAVAVVNKGVDKGFAATIEDFRSLR
jgi:GTP cyclohydrolase I